MSDRCPLTDLLRDQCAHCQGHEETASAADVQVHRTVRAVHHSRCALNGVHVIEPGDRIGHTEHGWICPGCTAAATA